MYEVMCRSNTNTFTGCVLITIIVNDVVVVMIGIFGKSLNYRGTST